ncbi:hypothetical protein [Cellulomonas edaphi]|uniref:Secreted protein n=1 Tax=Cellulomonas edaphi TaxID=3053468 RepID=A0ABT7S621_9CELL|nr:hypothetical protein [Cellulomons edaphi]MDM7830497.1 hypothetical protein [Cellulomons edaphi]
MSRISRAGRRRAVGLSALAVALVGVLAALAGVGPTSAAWTDPAYVTATASTGTWQGPLTCTVRNASGSLDASKPCTVTSVSAQFWGSPGSGQGSLTADFSAPGIAVNQYVAFDLTVPSASKPAWWDWSTSSVTSVNNNATITSACDALPQITGREGSNLGATPNVYITLSDRRAAGRLCS